MFSLLLLLRTFTRQSFYKGISSHHLSSCFLQWNFASAETHELHSLLFHWYHHYTAFTFWAEGWTSVVSILLVILYSWNTASNALQGIRHVLVFHWPYQSVYVDGVEAVTSLSLANGLWVLITIPDNFIIYLYLLNFLYRSPSILELKQKCGL